MAYYASRVIAAAENEVGYLEKKSNSSLDSKSANAGYNNYTKYARDFDTKYTTFYNGRKNGFAWCDVFVDWCFVTAYGESAALKLLGQPKKSCGAGCDWSAKYFKEIGRFYTSPKVGDQIFFKDSSGTPCHTGLVYKVDSYYVYTIEGNTSSASGVVANGGAVAKKKYSLSYSRIYGYGRPKYDTKATPTPVASTPKKVGKIEEWQKAAVRDGFDFPEYGTDGEWGAECEAVAKKAICKKLVVGYKNQNLTKFLQKYLGFTGSNIDGKFGNATKNAVLDFQKKYGLKVDGVVGLNTWKKILGV